MAFVPSSSPAGRMMSVNFHHGFQRRLPLLVKAQHNIFRHREFACSTEMGYHSYENKPSPRRTTYHHGSIPLVHNHFEFGAVTTSSWNEIWILIGGTNLYASSVTLGFNPCLWLQREQHMETHRHGKKLGG